MSYSHNQRRKVIRRFKRQYGDKWYLHFRQYIAELVKEKEPPITLEQLMKLVRSR